MKTCPIALKKIVEHFSPVGVSVTITPAEDFVINDGWHGPTQSLRDIWAIKHLGRLSLEASDEVAIGFLIHEIIHSIVARPAWDHTYDSDVYNWSRLKTLISEEHPIVIYGRDLIEKLDIQEIAIQSASTWEDETEIKKYVNGKRKTVIVPRKRGIWKQPGGDLLSHDSIGTPNRKNLAKAIKLFAAYGVMDRRGRLIGSFDINVAKKNVKTILDHLGERYDHEDVLGEFPQEESVIYNLKQAA